MAVKSVGTEAASAQLCKLCTLPVRQPVYDASVEGSDTFCCAGCRNVWRILVESGKLAEVGDPRQTDLFQRALAAGLIGGTTNYEFEAVESGSREVTAERKGGTLQDNRQCILQINGMWCSSCAWLIRQTLQRTRGVISAEVSFTSDTAKIVYRPARTDETFLAKTVGELGYSAAPLGEGNDADPRVGQRRQELLRTVIAIAFAMNVMMIQLILYAGYFEGISKAISSGLPWLLLALSIPVVAAAYPLFNRAVQAARQAAATMDTLVTLGASTALIYSIWQTFRGSGHVYYDTADMLLGLVMVGKFIETGARQNANDALTLLYGLLPRKAVVVRNLIEYPVVISQLADGDRILVRSGERIAADGTVESGEATVDESLLSGESKPINKRNGDTTIGGTVLMNGILTIRVDRVGDSGTLNQIVRHVEEALANKTPAEKLADRISRVFVPIVLGLAVASGIWVGVFSHGGAGEVMTRMVAVLVIACPCALGIATPMAISAGIAMAAKMGILISDGGVFETLRQLTHIVLDKTGTATEATFEVTRVFEGSDWFDSLSALEGRSSHPISAAIISKYPLNSSAAPITDFATVDGAGIVGTLGSIRLFAGNEKAVAEAGIELTAQQADFAAACSADGLTVIYWGVDGDRLHGAIGLGDKIRAHTAEAVAALQEMGISLELLSGDSAATTAFIARQLSISQYRGGASPKDKSDLVESLRSKGKKIGMVGDGVNDAPALAQADVGIALAAGTDIAARTAQITLLTPNLLLLPKLIKLSRRTVSTMRKNLFWAFLYNTVCIPLAMLGYVNPLWAVVAMLISSLTVILNTQRLTRS